MHPIYRKDYLIKWALRRYRPVTSKNEGKLFAAFIWLKRFNHCSTLVLNSSAKNRAVKHGRKAVEGDYSICSKIPLISIY
ncbi:hypothetical protein TUM4636_11600 [Shewanella glacialipiscicola]|nr:hypothetical protein TUM4636_11600 [Shewanella glacialipiscicola]